MSRQNRSKASSNKELTSKKIESRALYFAGGSFLIAGAFALYMFWGQMIPLFGVQSIGTASSVLAAIAAFVTFIISFDPPKNGKSGVYGVFRHWLTAGALAFLHAAIVFLFIAAGFYIFQNAFKGAVLDQWAAAFLAGASTGLSTYMVYLTATRLNSMRVSTSLAVFLFIGVVTSMITAVDPYWWQVNFSSLGTTDNFSSLTFNITLIISGLVMVLLSDFIAADFARLQKKNTEYANARVNTIRIALALIGLLLAATGIFKWDDDELLHNLAAYGMAVVFALLVCALPWLAIGFTRTFFIFSYSLVTAIAISYRLWITGYFNQTVFEMVSAGIVFVWLVVFVRQIAAGLEDKLSVKL